MSEQNSVSFVYRLLRGTFRLLFRLLTRLDVRGMEQTPLDGPLLMTANHTSLLEGPLVFAYTPRVPVSVLAKKEWEGTPIATFVIDHLNPVYVNRGEMDRKALTVMLRRLKGGEAFGIAPEGTRSESGSLMQGKEGAAYLATRSNAQLLPIAVWGHTELFSSLKRFRRPTVHLHVGEPYRLVDDPDLSRQENLAAHTERIMVEIARLLPPELRGDYAHAVEGPARWQRPALN
ncbi:MAG: 1-acyl-sn-glycerol-3-phosphate acyltransferase [Anaerolineales bacterium]|nr:1-acyl-sn-glycerol-3-phosphate acyltransferase [Anaerolineales bacterium]MCB9127353.1 1-acyl-sn-glycerol-3-phosphate acyltransferase [Ardenticatenales bacterium]MCB9136742.1 1-acyl-sn-glycerol-3-phosphate acyltransferase [Caldilineaceae bacterium]